MPVAERINSNGGLNRREFLREVTLIGAWVIAEQTVGKVLPRKEEEISVKVYPIGGKVEEESLPPKLKELYDLVTGEGASSKQIIEFNCRILTYLTNQEAIPGGKSLFEDLSPYLPSSAEIKVGSLNIRSGPGIDFDRLGSLKKDEMVNVVGKAENGWLLIIYNNPSDQAKLGFISGNPNYTEAERTDLVPTLTIEEIQELFPQQTSPQEEKPAEQPPSEPKPEEEGWINPGEKIETQKIIFENNDPRLKFKLLISPEELDQYLTQSGMRVVIVNQPMGGEGRSYGYLLSRKFLGSSQDVLAADIFFQEGQRTLWIYFYLENLSPDIFADKDCMDNVFELIIAGEVRENFGEEGLIRITIPDDVRQCYEEYRASGRPEGKYYECRSLGCSRPPHLLAFK